MKLAGKKILVTGGSGFIASHLVHRLVNAGHTVAVLTKYDSIVDNIRLALIWDKITVIEADLRNSDSLKLVAQWKPDVVFHFAAYNHVGDSFIHVSEAIDSNTKGTANLLEAWPGFQKFIYISTSEVYGFQPSVPFVETMEPHPISPYSVGKYAGELYARMKHHVDKLPITVLRPFNAFGPYQSPRAVIAEMVIKCLAGKTIEATEGKQTREFNYVEDLVDGFLLAAESDKAVGDIFNIGCGTEISIKDLIQKIHKMTNSKSELKIGARPYRPTEIWRMYADNAKAKSVLGWQPRTSLDDGLKLTVQWFRDFLGVCNGDKTLATLGYGPPYSR